MHISGRGLIHVVQGGGPVLVVQGGGLVYVQIRVASGYVQDTGVEVHVGLRGVLRKWRQGVLAAFYTITCYGGPGYVLARGLAEDVDDGVAEDVDEVVGWSYPDKTCCWLTGPAQNAFLSS